MNSASSVYSADTDFRVVPIESLVERSDDFTNGFFIVRIMSDNDIGRSDYAGHQQ
jgi:hypothetical protein